MAYIYSLFLIVSFNIDILGIGICYGIKNVKIDFKNNCIISFISGLFTLVPLYCSSFIIKKFNIENFNNIGAFMLMIIGIYYIYKYVKNKETLESNIIDVNNYELIDIKEALVLGIVFSINNIGLAITISVLNVSIFFTTMSTFIVTLVFIKLGYYLGEKHISSRLSNYAELISGILILIIGICNLF